MKYSIHVITAYIRQSPPWTVALFLMLFTIVILLNTLVVMPSEKVSILFINTNNFLSQGIICSAFSLLVLVYLYIHKYCNIPFNDLGISKLKVWHAILIGSTILFLSLIAQVVITGRVSIVDTVDSANFSDWLSSGLDNLMAATFEEITIRGFLLLQLTALLKGKNKYSTAWAIIVSSLFFTINHIPGWIAVGKSVDYMELAILLFISILLSIIYLKYYNICLSIVLHFVINTPAVIFHTYDLTFQVVFLAVALCLIFAPFKLINEWWFSKTHQLHQPIR